MKHRRNAILWAIGWWIVRRQVRRRAAVAVAGVGATGRRRSAGGSAPCSARSCSSGCSRPRLVAARKLLASGEPGEAPSLADVPPPPFPDAPAAPAEPDPGPAPA